MGYGTVLLGPLGEVLMANAVAIRLLQQEAALGSPTLDALASAVRRLFRRGNAPLPAGADTYVVIPRDEKRDLVLHAVSVRSSRESGAETLVIMVDLAGSPEPKPEVLQRMFELTAAEARVAIRIARGDTPADIVKETRVSMATVRSQLASVFAKTQTSRQAELISLLARVSVLS